MENQRKELYLFLSNSFAYPDKIFIDAVIEGTYFERINELSQQLGFYNNNENLNNCFLGLKREEVEELLKVEYTRLFINNPLTKLPVPPYESCYKGSGQLMDSETINSLNNYYQQIGLLFPEESEVLPDHISVEYEFMSYLIEGELEAKANKNEKIRGELIEIERKFIQDHLIKWIPILADKLHVCSRVQFYKNLAHLAKSFLESETKYLNSATGIINMEV